MSNQRIKAIRFFVSDEEFTKIATVAEASGIRPAQFARMMTMNAARKWKTLDGSEKKGKDEQW